MSQWKILGNKEKKERLKGPGDCLKGQCQLTMKENALKFAERRKREKNGLGNCLKGQYRLTMKEYAMKFAERSLTLSPGQENELVLENGSGNKGAGETN